MQGLRAAFPVTHSSLLIGQDQYRGLHSWRNCQTLLVRVVLAVANRPGPARQPHPDVLRFPHRMVPLPMLDISSTDIRQRAEQGRDITELVPLEVARYIETHALYRATPRS